MMAKVYFVRHGQTQSNANGVIHGATDIPLNDVGRVQAAETGKRLRDIKFDAVYASPLSRARETCEIILKHNKFGGKIKFDDRLKERNFGILEGIELKDPRFNGISNANNEKFIQGCETLAQLFGRVGDFLRSLKAKGNILVVSHCAVERMVYFHFNPKPADGNLRVRAIPNAEIAEYDLNLFPQNVTLV